MFCDMECTAYNGLEAVLRTVVRTSRTSIHFPELSSLGGGVTSLIEESITVLI